MKLTWALTAVFVGEILLHLPVNAQVKFNENGVLTLHMDGLLLQNLSAVLIKPGWQGSYADQLNPKTVKVTHKTNGEQVWIGIFQGDGAEVDFVQRATVKASEIVLTYEFRPRTEVSLETLMLRCFLPTEVAAGKAIWVAFDDF
ncbi:MAG: hypothetical protein RUDDFDWM_002096, partial [Candidatus Fervidibacterota bacterium]